MAREGYVVCKNCNKFFDKLRSGLCNGTRNQVHEERPSTPEHYFDLTFPETETQPPRNFQILKLVFTGDAKADQESTAIFWQPKAEKCRLSFGLVLVVGVTKFSQRFSSLLFQRIKFSNRQFGTAELFLRSKASTQQSLGFQMF